MPFRAVRYPRQALASTRNDQLGAAVAARLSKAQLERTIVILLFAIGVAFVVEGFVSHQAAGIVPQSVAWHFLAGVTFGLGIGFVSSILGVAGGEMIIPTLIFAFGVDTRRRARRAC